MKKVKIYIVTYKRNDVVNQLIDNLYQSDLTKLLTSEQFSITVINNHTDFKLTAPNKARVSVLHNQTRPDWSCGNLGENWNQALIHGFKSLKQPDTELVVTLQNDCVLHPKWYSHLTKMHKNYDLVVGEFGDNIISYTPKAVIKIGLWDENFSAGVAHKEADYFLRAVIRHGPKVLIGDTMHQRLWNNKDYLTLDITEGRNIVDQEVRAKRRPDNSDHKQIWEEGRNSAVKKYNESYMYRKWSNTWSKGKPSKRPWIVDWDNTLLKNLPKIKPNTMFMRYPFFEMDIEYIQCGYWDPGYTAKEWEQWRSKLPKLT